MLTDLRLALRLLLKSPGFQGALVTGYLFDLPGLKPAPGRTFALTRMPPSLPARSSASASISE